MAWTKADVERVLRRSGFSLDHHGAKHDVFTREGHPRIVVVPRHTGDLPIGTVRSIFRQADLDPHRAEELR